MTSLVEIPRTPEAIRAALLAYHQASAPIIESLVRLEAVARPRYLIGPDSEITKLDDGYTPAMREVRDGLLQHLHELAASYGLVLR